MRLTSSFIFLIPLSAAAASAVSDPVALVNQADVLKDGLTGVSLTAVHEVTDTGGKTEKQVYRVLNEIKSGASYIVISSESSDVNGMVFVIKGNKLYAAAPNERSFRPLGSLNLDRRINGSLFSHWDLQGNLPLGVEYEPDMVALSQRNAREAGVADRATLVRGDMFETDFSQATVLTLFLLPGNLRRLTPKFLDLLDRHGVTATFFLLGAHVERHRDVVRDLHARGHELAVHGWDHRCVAWKRPGRLVDDLRRTVSALTTLTGAPVRWYRPPYGVLTAEALAAARSAGLRTVLWSAWGRDWERAASAESVAHRVTAALRPGGTVLLHDSDRTSAPGSWRATLAASDLLLTDWSAKGYDVGPLRDHRPF